MIGARRLSGAALLGAVAAVLAATPGAAGPEPGEPFSMRECPATGAGAPDGRRPGAAWAGRDSAWRAAACRDGELAHRERARWEAEHRVARERLRFQEAARRFRAERARSAARAAAPGEPAILPAGDPETLPACSRPDATGECRATPAQILYQIQRSRQAHGPAPAERKPGGDNLRPSGPQDAARE